MLKLIKKDFVFTKWVIVFALLYSTAIPIILKIDGEKFFFADLLIPLVLGTIPLSKILHMEDTKSGLIFQKTLPYRSAVRVATRFVFAAVLIVLSELVVALSKTYIFQTTDLLASLHSAVLYGCGFMAYIAVLLALFYWRGYMASQGALYILIILVFVLHTLFGKDKLGQLLSHLPSIWLIVAITLLFVTAMCYFCSVLENRRNI